MIDDDDFDSFMYDMGYDLIAADQLLTQIMKGLTSGTQVKREHSASSDAPDGVLEERQAEHAQSQAVPLEEAETGSEEGR